MNPAFDAEPNFLLSGFLWVGLIENHGCLPTWAERASGELHDLRYSRSRLRPDAGAAEASRRSSSTATTGLEMQGACIAQHHRDRRS